MHQLAWVRLMVARHPSIYWSAIAVTAGVVALGTASALSGVDTARRSWGRQETVWVATASIEPGELITATSRDVPAAVVPVGAIHDAPEGMTARQHLGEGEMVTSSDVAADGSAGLIPDGWVAFTVAMSVEHFAIGDRLTVFSVDRLLGPGLVVDRGESELMVAVPADAAPAMAGALLADAVTVALTPALTPPSPPPLDPLP
jgi:SAF domain